MKKIMLFLIAFLLFACNPKTTKKEEPAFSYVYLSGADSLTFLYNFRRGEAIAKYDKKVARATDLLLSQVVPDKEKYQYYIYSDHDDSEKVYFGKLYNETFEINYIVTFRANETVYSTPETPVTDQYISKLAHAVDLFFDVNEEELWKYNFRYNFVVIRGGGDSVIVYGTPGFANNKIYMCGGIKTAFSYTTGDLISNQLLHLSPIGFTYPSEATTITRTSSKNHIINELDIAQSLINIEFFKHQLIDTGKYIFVFKYSTNNFGFSYTIIKPPETLQFMH